MGWRPRIPPTPQPTVHARRSTTSGWPTLDGRIRREIATIPVERRQAITGHASFRYFTRAYGVRFDAPRGYSTGSEPTARDVANLIRQVREQKTKALFIENMTNPALVAEIARDSGAWSAHRSTATRCPGPAARRRPTRR